MVKLYAYEKAHSENRCTKSLSKFPSMAYSYLFHMSGPKSSIGMLPIGVGGRKWNHATEFVKYTRSIAWKTINKPVRLNISLATSRATTCQYRLQKNSYEVDAMRNW